tara:strand:- start:211 stop:543 length:333 start_codon:yes stop_codon:yes gene_type:complete
MPDISYTPNNIPDMEYIPIYSNIPILNIPNKKAIFDMHSHSTHEIPSHYDNNLEHTHNHSNNGNNNNGLSYDNNFDMAIHNDINQSHVHDHNHLHYHGDYPHSHEHSHIH